MKKKNKLNTLSRPSTIVALCIVSESEIARGFPEYDSSWEAEQPSKLLNILYGLGMDINQNYTRQDGLMHRNRLNEIVLCSRFVGQERLDLEWLTSGYASQAARDKASGSRLLEDIYRARNLTEEAQHRLEARDKYQEPIED